MSGIDQPIYLVAFRDEWVVPEDTPLNLLAAFGTRDEAEIFAREVARQRRVDPALYRIVEFVAGEVREL
jgi:hypothetical protein